MTHDDQKPPANTPTDSLRLLAQLPADPDTWITETEVIAAATRADLAIREDDGLVRLMASLRRRGLVRQCSDPAGFRWQVTPTGQERRTA
ncbi:MAG TPA: hypothetical protein VFP72_07355 [Kineosporiaceae bacterium]|nr:hypothetical protein [Kineosporiaceae bacterium]